MEAIHLIGRMVRVIANFTGHEFEIGDIVKVISLEDVDSYLCSDKNGGRWFLSENEFMLPNIEEIIENLPNFKGSGNTSIIYNAVSGIKSPDFWSYTHKNNQMIIEKGDNISWEEVISEINNSMK